MRLHVLVGESKAQGIVFEGGDATRGDEVAVERVSPPVFRVSGARAVRS
jgi:hypothetical protein